VVKPPVIVHASTLAAAELLAELLGEDYGPAVDAGEGGDATVLIEPIDEKRRGVVLYRVIQASRNVAEQMPGVDMFLMTDEGSRWRLPPPAI
jgi:xanthine/CO dehydrogenase XdhC/CoxF family maturation factor